MQGPVVSARIDHLDEVPKQVLETAAVIGRVVSLPILERVTALPNDLRAVETIPFGSQP